MENDVASDEAGVTLDSGEDAGTAPANYCAEKSAAENDLSFQIAAICEVHYQT